MKRREAADITLKRTDRKQSRADAGRQEGKLKNGRRANKDGRRGKKGSRLRQSLFARASERRKVAAPNVERGKRAEGGKTKSGLTAKQARGAEPTHKQARQTQQPNRLR